MAGENGGEKRGKLEANTENLMSGFERLTRTIEKSIESNDIAHNILHKRIDGTNKEVVKLQVNVARLFAWVTLLAGTAALAVKILF